MPNVNFNSGLSAVVQLATGTASQSVDISAGDLFVCNGLTVNLTLSFTGGSADYNGKKVMIRVKQDGTGGRTVTFDTSTGKAKYGTDITTFTASTAASATDYIGVVYDSVADKYHIVSYAKGY